MSISTGGERARAISRSSEMTRLTKEEWNQLDNLLNKHGFGGYYDLLECLKILLSRVAKDRYKEAEIKDIKTAIEILLLLTKKEDE